MSAQAQFAYDPLIDAMQRIRNQMNDAYELGIPDACSATLATVGYEARPSIRTINIAAILDLGLAFFTHCDSGKHKQMLTNPNIALCLFWPQMQQQVTIEGYVEALHNEEADAIWFNRSPESRLLDCAQRQNSLPRSEALDEFTGEQELPRPAEWTGQLLHPRRVEFYTVGERNKYQRDLFMEGPDRRWHVITSQI